MLIPVRFIAEVGEANDEVFHIEPCLPFTASEKNDRTARMCMNTWSAVGHEEDILSISAPHVRDTPGAASKAAQLSNS